MEICRLTFNGYAMDWNNSGYFEMYKTKYKNRVMCLTEGVKVSREQRENYYVPSHFAMK